MPANSHVMGIFKEEEKVVAAIGLLRKSPWKFKSVHGPYASHSISKALAMKKSGVGWFTLIGGITGFITGYALSIYTSVQWNLIVGGKKVVSLIPFFVVGYECTILFGVLGTVLGVLILSRLPGHKSLKHYDVRCSRDHFGILATCHKESAHELAGLFERAGGEARHMSDEADEPPGLSFATKQENGGNHYE